MCASSPVMTTPQLRRQRQQARLLIAVVATLVALASNFLHLRLQVATPVQPKRASNAYMHFAAEKRNEYKKPEMSAAQVAKTLGEAWRSMSDAEKAPFMRKAADDKKRFEEALAAFKEEGGVMHTKAKRAKEAKKPSKVKTRTSEKKPKKPRAASAYNLFVKERMLELKKSSNLKASMKDIAKEWKELPDAKKTALMAEAADAKAALTASHDARPAQQGIGNGNGLANAVNLSCAEDQLLPPDSHKKRHGWLVFPWR